MPPIPKNLNPRKITNPAEYIVTAIEKPVSKQMVLDNHYSGRCPGIKYCFGLLENAVLVGTVVYSIPASYTLCKGVCGDALSSYVIELARLVITTKSKNAASTLISRSLKLLPDHVVVSYADCNEHVGHVGYVYQATNWIYTGQGNAEPVWVHPTTGEVISYTRRHIDTKALEHGLDWKELKRRKQVGKHRYVIFTGSKSFKVCALNELRYSVYPYPKGQTARHESAIMQTADKPVAPPSIQKQPTKINWST